MQETTVTSASSMVASLTLHLQAEGRFSHLEGRQGMLGAPSPTSPTVATTPSWDGPGAGKEPPPGYKTTLRKRDPARRFHPPQPSQWSQLHLEPGQPGATWADRRKSKERL